MTSNNQYLNLSHPTRATAVVPSDSVDLTNPGILYLGTDGDVTVGTFGGDIVTFTAAAAGFFPVSVKRVYATGTTATGIIVLY